MAYTHKVIVENKFDMRMNEVHICEVGLKNEPGRVVRVLKGREAWEFLKDLDEEREEFIASYQ